MSTLDIYRMSGVSGYLVEVQADMLGSLATTVVVPLLPLNASPKPMARLNPVFEIAGVPHVMATQLISAVPRKELGRPVGALAELKYYEVTNALDMLLSRA